MLRWLDYSKIKREKHAMGGEVVYYRCACPCCEKCWYRPDTEQCMCGGPYSGYQSVEAGGELPQGDSPQALWWLHHVY